MRKLVAALLAVVTGACATSPDAPERGPDLRFETTLLESELSGRMRADGYLEWTPDINENNRLRFRRFIVEVNGEAGPVPDALRREAHEVYSTLTKSNFAASAPTLRIVDCGSASARVNIVGEIELCRGALVRLSTRDEVAYLLSHELAHILLKHDERLRNEPTLGVDLESTLFFTRSLRHLVRSPELRAAWLRGRVGEANYSRREVAAAMQQHVVADLLGTDLMARAGFSTDGAYTAISLMGGSGRPQAGAWNEYVSSDARLETLQAYVETFHPEVDLKPQTPMTWQKDGGSDAATFVQAMKLLDEAVYELGLAKKVDAVVSEDMRDYAESRNTRFSRLAKSDQDDLVFHFMSKERIAARRVFCDSARSKLQHANELYFSGDRQVIEISLGIGTVCDGGTWFDTTEALLAQVEGRPIDGAWREIAQIFTLFSLGMPSSEEGGSPSSRNQVATRFSRSIDQRFKHGDAALNDLLGTSSGNLNLIGSLFTLNANMRVRYDDSLRKCLKIGSCQRSFEQNKFIRACKRTAGKPFGIVSPDHCEAYINRLSEQVLLVFHRTGEVPGRSIFRKYTFPGADVPVPDQASINPLDHDLYDWRRGSRIGSDTVIAQRLNARAVPSRRGQVLGQFRKRSVVFKTGRMDGEWIEIVVEGGTAWVHGQYLLRSHELVSGRAAEEARETLGLAGTPVDFSNLHPDWSDAAWQAGSNPAFEMLMED